MNRLPELLRVLYPFAENAFAAPDGRLNYVDEGAGEPVLMFHGNPTWSFFYRDLVLALRGEFRCLALDNLGCGLSDKPQHGTYTLAAHIQRACDWVDSLGLESFHVVVHDWGGPIGLGMAGQFAGRVKSISILNTAAFEFPSIPLRIAACRVPLAGPLLVRGANAFARGATRMTTVEPLSDAVKAGYLFPYGSWSDRVAINAFVRDIPMRASHGSWAALKSVEASLGQWRGGRVGIFWGMQDWCFHPRILAAWESILPEARVSRFADAGHYLMEDMDGAVVEAVAGFIRAGAQRP